VDPPGSGQSRQHQAHEAPDFFVNGKPIPSFEPFQDLVQEGWQTLIASRNRGPHGQLSKLAHNIFPRLMDVN
jgi:hypothetical protein